MFIRNAAAIPFGLLLVSGAADRTLADQPASALGREVRLAAVRDSDARAPLHQTESGEWFFIQRTIIDGLETHVFQQNARAFDRAQMDEHERDNPKPTVNADLLNSAAKLPPDTVLELVVWLVDNPAPAIARREREREAPMLHAIRDRTAAIRRTALPIASLPPEQERNWLAAMPAVGAPLAADKAAILDQLALEQEARTAAIRQRVFAEVRASIAPGQAALAASVQALGGQVRATIAMRNGATINLPASSLPLLALDPAIARIIPLPYGQAELEDQAVSLGLTTGFWPAGIDGGTFDVGAVDSELQFDHPAFDSHVMQNAPSIDGDDLNSCDPGHGTGVCGILCSDDPVNRGMAWGCDKIIYGQACGASYVDADWMVSTAADDPENINVSWTYGTVVLDYDDDEKFFDGLVDDHSVSVSKSAGNGGNGAETITQPAPAYNITTVANMADADDTDRSNDVITASSSRGPTPAGRKKPDISAPGTNTFTTRAGWATGADFGNFGGTSAAAPHVGGAVVLLADLRNDDTPIAAKAILINTADAWEDAGTLGSSADDAEITGTEWNQTYGWGYLDLEEAHFNGLDAFESTVDDGVTPVGPDFKLYTGVMFAGEKATLVWNRHLAYDGDNAPTMVEALTDLDLIAYRESTGATIDSSISSIDNVEQIAVAAVETVVLKVDVFGTLDADVAIESFALATEENFVAATAPGFSIVASPVVTGPDTLFTLTFSVNNTGSVNAHNVNVNLTLPAGFSLISGADPQNIGTVTPETNGEAVWTVRAPCALGLFDIDWAVSSASYGETFSDSGSFSIALGTAALVSDVPQSALTAPRTYSFAVLANEWHAVGVHCESDLDNDVAADTDICITTPYQTSNFGDPTIEDFIVTNGHIYAPGTHYVEVNGSDSFTVEMHTAFDLGINGVPVAQTMSASEILNTYEASLIVGRSYSFEIDQTAGACNIALWAYRSDVDDADRNTADFETDETGNGGDESLVIFNAPVAGAYALVVTNENHNATNFTARVRQICRADINLDGVQDVPDIFAFLALWFAADPIADWDHSGGVPGVPDIFAFLASWFAGC